MMNAPKTKPRSTPRPVPPSESDTSPLVITRPSAERVTLYITAALPDKKEAWQFEARQGVEAYYWANDAVTCTIVADLPEDKLRMLGRKVFEQLTRRPENTFREW